MQRSFVRGVVFAVVLGMAMSADAGVPRRIHVNAGLVGGAGNGSSWADAFRGRLGLRDALLSVQPGELAELWIAAGTYAPAPMNGDRGASFVVGSGVALLGGFVGNETDPESRNPVLHPAILSGDLNGDGGAPGLGGVENSRQVVRMVNADSTAVLDGLVIELGNADGQPFPNDDVGANLFISGGSPVVRDCGLRAGYATRDGGGAAVIGASPTIVRCAFENCRASFRGAGVFHSGGSTAELVDCRFVGNQATLGAGMFNGLGAGTNAPRLTRCDFLNNGAPTEFGGAGVGLFDELGSPVIDRCRFIGGITVAGGGGVYLVGSSARITNCDFVGNAAFGDGGGAVVVTGDPSAGGMPGPIPEPAFFGCRFTGNNGVLVGGFGSSALFVNCTMAHNGVGELSGWPLVLAEGGPGVMRFVNCVVWGNPSIGLPPKSAYTLHLDGRVVTRLGATVSFERCLLEGMDSADPPIPGMDNLCADPRFVDAAGADLVPGTVDDDLRVRAASPAIDAGDSGAFDSATMVDFGGLPRVLDDAGVPDGGSALPPVIDIGCHEFQSATSAACLADANGDGVVGLGDLALVITNWALGGEPGTRGDIDRDGERGLTDLASIIAGWGEKCASS